MGVTTNISVNNIAGWLEGSVRKYTEKGSIKASK
jgi:hypothetical protein